MSDDRRDEPPPPPDTGAVDADRRGRDEKMDREQSNTDAPGVRGRDVRGMGRQMKEQQKREPDFDRKRDEFESEG